MKFDALTAEPTSRCKVCGDAGVVAVCHHCAATLCQDHAVNGATGSREFRSLDARNQGQDVEPSHCADCTHRLLATGDAVAIFLISLVLGLLVLATPSSPVVGVVVVIILVMIAAALALVLQWQRNDEVLDRCPVMPEIENERIVETYRYRSLLSRNGQWRHRRLEADGVARADLRFGPDDIMRIERFSAAAGRPDDVSVVDAGFVLLRLAEDGKNAIDGVNLADDGDRFGAQRVILDTTEVPYLRPDEPAYRQPEATSAVKRSSSVHQWSMPFEIRVADDDSRLPVQIFPTLAPGSDRRSLEFHIHWPDTSSPMDRVADRVVNGIGDHRPTYIEYLEFRLPVVGLGQPTPLDGDPIITEETGPDGVRVQKVRWEQVDVGRGEASKRLSVRFEHPIPPDIHVIGRLAVRFDRSLAGIADMAWFDAMGRSSVVPGQGNGRTKATTASVVDVAFNFSMESLPYEASFVYLERPIPVTSSLLASIRPDHRTSIELAHRLTECGFSIFRITESTFAPSDRSAEENRIWELWGRYFENTAPLNFQIKVGGADLRRRLEGTGEDYEVTTVTLAAQAGVDGPGTLAEFEAQLRTIEEQTTIALERLAGQGSVELGTGGVTAIDPRRNGFDPELLASLTPTTTGQIPTWSVAQAPRDYDVADYRQGRRCSMCARGGDHEDYSLCHHCGRLVCLERCSVTVRRDPAFVRGVDRLNTTASHCEGCAEQEHPLSFRLHRISRSRAVARLRTSKD